MRCALMYRQNGDLANLLKSARKKSAPECPFECGGGGCNRYLGNAQIEVTLNSKVLPLHTSERTIVPRTVIFVYYMSHLYTMYMSYLYTTKYHFFSAELRAGRFGAEPLLPSRDGGAWDGPCLWSGCYDGRF